MGTRRFAAAQSHRRNLSADNINMKLHAGTLTFPAVLTIPTAVDFHFAVGAAARAQHRRALRDRWVNAIADTSVTVAVSARYGEPASRPAR